MTLQQKRIVALEETIEECEILMKLPRDHRLRIQAEREHAAATSTIARLRKTPRRCVARTPVCSD